MKNMFVEYLYLTLYHKTTSVLQMHEAEALDLRIGDDGRARHRWR